MTAASNSFHHLSSTEKLTFRMLAMRIVDYLFGTRPASRLVKAVFYLAWLSMLPDFLNAHWRGIAWMNFSMPVVIFSFLLTGLFMAFAGKEELIDYWRPQSKLGRQLSDPLRGATNILGLRFVGIMFVLATIYMTVQIFPIIQSDMRHVAEIVQNEK